MNTIWDILGIPPTSDKKAIKKAYAAKCAFCHPEEQPEEFDRLHKAYTSAIRAAGRVREEETSGKPEAGVLEAGETPSGGDSGNAGTGGSLSGGNAGNAGTGGSLSGGNAGNAGTGKTRPSGENGGNAEAGVLGSEGTLSGETTGKTNVSQSTVSPFTPPPQPEIPFISQLVERGMEQEIRSASHKLLESFRKLHASFPKSVNTDEEEFTKALRHLDQWFDSPRFKLAGWEPDFLKQLNQWLSKNRKKVNRAEAVALYKGYRFKDYGSPAYPFAAHIGDVRREVMRQALRYEEDMVRMAGMPQPRPKSSRPPKKIWSRLRLAALCLLLLFTAVLVGIYLTSRRSSSSLNLQETAREKIRSSFQQNPYVLTEKASEESGSPEENSPEKDKPLSSESWIYDGFGPVKRPENQPFNPAEYEYYGKSRLTAAYRRAMPVIQTGNTLSSPLMAVTAGLTGIQIDGSYLSQNQERDGVYYYSLKALGKTSVEFPVWVVPSGKDFTGKPVYTIGGCGYWAEALGTYASREDIPVRLWYDSRYMAHLVLMWDSVQTLPDLTERLVEMSANYYESVQGDAPTIYLTILIGPEGDRAADLLETVSEMVTSPAQVDSGLITAAENELLAQKGNGPLPIASNGEPSQDLSRYDSSIQWLARIPMEKDGSNGAFHPGLTKKEAQDQILENINGLDWALWRFEISAGE